MPQSGNWFVRHELLEKPIPEPFTEGCGSKPCKDMIRKGDSGVSCQRKGKAVIQRNFEMTSGSLLHDEVPIHVFLFYKKRDVSCKGSGQISSVNDIVSGQIHQKVIPSQAFHRDPFERSLSRPLPDHVLLLDVPHLRDDIQ